MKIEGLDTPLEQITPEDEKMPTLRNILRLVGKIKTRTHEDARAVTRVIRKLQAKEDAVEFDDMEIKVIRTCITDNPMNLTGWAQGQVLERLDVDAKV